MCRKHMNANYEFTCNKNRPPFYSWECITIQCEGRDIDLVIPKDKDMNDLLEVLVFAMNTVDGNRDSAKVVYNRIQLEKMKEELVRRDQYNADKFKAWKKN